MSDNGEEDEDEPVVELGDGDAVDGAPVARVASRLFFPIEKSEIRRREGETTIRTHDGPQSVADVLERSDEVYFATSHDFVDAVREVVGTGAVPTAGGGSESGAANGGDEGDQTDAEAADDDGGFEFDDG